MVTVIFSLFTDFLFAHMNQHELEGLFESPLVHLINLFTFIQKSNIETKLFTIWPLTNNYLVFGYRYDNEKNLNASMTYFLLQIIKSGVQILNTRQLLHAVVNSTVLTTEIHTLIRFTCVIQVWNSYKLLICHQLEVNLIKT